MKIMFNHEEIEGIKLDDYIIKNRDASFMLRVKGGNMIESGIYEGDLVIVERGKEPRQGDIVMVCHEGQFKMVQYSKKLTSKEWSGNISAEPLTIEAVAIAIIRKLTK